MSKQRLFSSDEIINALLRCGFELARKSKKTIKRSQGDDQMEGTTWL
jgi:hypothetical protein